MHESVETVAATSTETALRGRFRLELNVVFWPEVPLAGPATNQRSSVSERQLSGRHRTFLVQVAVFSSKRVLSPKIAIPFKREYSHYLKTHALLKS